MVGISIGCTKIQITCGRNEILNLRALGGINRHFPPKCLPLGKLTFSTTWGGIILARNWDL